MLGCIGSREKPLPASSVEPFAVRGVSRSPTSVTFEFGLEAVGDSPRVATDTVSCNVQNLEASALSSTWVALPDTTWRELAPAEAADARKRGLATARKGGEPARKGEQVRCLAIVPGLLPEKDYTFRLLARGSLKEQAAFSAPFVVRTSDRPKLDAAGLLCSRRWADSIEVEWPLADPDGAPVEECLAQCRPDGMMSSWMPEASLAAMDSSPSTEGGCRRWRGRLVGLSGASSYRVHARARNAVGWSQAFCPELMCYTSDVPPAPRGLICLRRQPNSVTVWMTLEDPEGAPVTECSVQIHGVLGYSVHVQSRFLRMEPAQSTLDGGPGKVNRPAMCIVDGLQPETEYYLRLYVQNASGTSKQPSLPLQVFTSDRPKPPTQFTVKVGPRVIEVEWELTDPVGAPVLACELEYCRDSVWSSWQTLSGEPVALVGAGAAQPDGPTALAASVLLSQATAVNPAVRLWRLRIDGLERETAYSLRVRAQNCIGWSSHSHTEKTATSDRPCSPQGLTCVQRFPTAVRLEFSVPEVLGTAPVSQIHIEKSGSFSWQELQDVDVTRVEPSSPGLSHWSVMVNLGMDPVTTHRLRAWASNDFGRCSEPSSICACRTSDRPSPLLDLECTQRLPHALVLTWSLPDPEGASIWRFEVQCRRDQALSSWQAAVCADTTRCEVDKGEAGENEWRCVVEQLEPNSAYRLCVRALNEVGWSEWFTSQASLETSGLPQPPSSLAVRSLVDTSAVGVGAEQEYLIVDLELSDPEGAPVVACMVKCMPQGVWTLCRRDGRSSPGRWRSRLPRERSSKDSADSSTLRIRSANAVGWSQHEEQSAAIAAASPAGSGTGGEASAVELVFGQVHEALEAQQLARGRLATLAAQATARGDHEHAALIARHRVEAEKRMEVLQEVEQQVGSALSSGGEDQGAVLVSQLNQALQRHKLVPTPSAAAKILSLLLRGYMWLETSWRTELKSLTGGIAHAMEKATTAGGKILWHWAKQHQAWSQSFDDRVGETLPEGLASAVQLLTTLASGRRLESFESVRGDLKECLTLVAAAERQLKRLRMSHRVLHAAEASSCHDFEQKGLLRKIESTALGIVTMMVLPLPGSIEVGTLGIGMMWLEGDAANSHLALQHPTGVPLAPVLQRLGSCPPPRAAVILAGWAEGGHRGVVLVHNATARRITVTATPEKGTTLASRAYAKLQDAHPMVKLVGYAMSESDGADHIATVLPTDLVLIQVPDEGTSGQAALARLEFSYGPQTHAEKAVGWAVVGPGSALSFVRLDSSLQVSNVEGENASVEEGTVRLVNNDLAAVTISVFRAPEKQKHFEAALLTEVLEAGEEKRLPLPQPCTGRIFQVEVRYESRQKALCEVRAGQCVTIEGCV